MPKFTTTGFPHNPILVLSGHHANRQVHVTPFLELGGQLNHVDDVGDHMVADVSEPDVTGPPSPSRVAYRSACVPGPPSCGRPGRRR